MSLKKFYTLIIKPTRFFNNIHSLDFEAFIVLLMLPTVIIIGMPQHIQNWSLKHLIGSLFVVIYMSIMFLLPIIINALIVIILLKNRKLFFKLVSSFIYCNVPTIFLYLTIIIYPNLLIDNKYYLISMATIFRNFGITNLEFLKLAGQLTPFFIWSFALVIIAIGKICTLSYKKSFLLAIFLELIDRIPYFLYFGR